MRSPRLFAGVWLSLFLFTCYGLGQLQLPIPSSNSLPPPPPPSPVVLTPVPPPPQKPSPAPLAADVPAAGPAVADSQSPKPVDTSPKVGSVLKVPHAASIEPVRGPLRNATFSINGTLSNNTQLFASGGLNATLPSGGLNVPLKSPAPFLQKLNATDPIAAGIVPTNSAFRKPLQGVAAGSLAPVPSGFIRATRRHCSGLPLASSEPPVVLPCC